MSMRVQYLGFRSLGTAEAGIDMYRMWYDHIEIDQTLAISCYINETLALDEPLKVAC